MKRRKICVVTGSRAEYGLLSGLMRCICSDDALRLSLVVTGAHLSRQLGFTCKEIERDGFAIDYRVPVLRFGDDDVGITKSIGLGCMKFADAFASLRPDIVVLLGDRYEILAAAIAAYTAKIALAHIHGGETTQGAMDEAYRHSITKMAGIHFTSTETHRRRVMQLGEAPDRVFNVGAPGLDALYGTTLLSRDELARDLGLDLSSKVALMTYHPETLEKTPPEVAIQELLSAVAHFDGQIVFTKANADPMGERINLRLAKFCRQNEGRAVLVANLGHRRYLSCLKHFDLMVGNSSSGIIEAPSFGLPVVNVGDRQKGRVRGKNIIDVACRADEITNAISKALSASFKNAARAAANPYDPYRDGKAALRMKDILKSIKLGPDFLKKAFVDIENVKRENC